MQELWVWMLTVEALGLCALPLAAVALPNLADRGWSLAKPLALLLISFACWLPPMLIPVLPYSRGWIAVVTLLFIAGNVALVVARPQIGRDLLAFARRQWPFVIVESAAFGGVMWVMGSLRALSPAAEGTEKFMDQAFLSAIIRAQHLPPPDPWLSGYPINYYYFGHFILATLAKLLGTAAPVAFNIGIALTAGLAAGAITGVAANLAARVLASRHPDANGAALNRAVPFALFSLLAALVLGNLRSFWVWWQGITATATLTHQSTLGAAWQWLSHPAQWGNFDFWNPTRAIPLTITEFPNFSFLLADLHAHVLALPYTVLGIGIALSLSLAPMQRGWGIFGQGWRRVPALLVAGVSLGALYFLNGWDLPTYLGLALLAIAAQQWLAHDRHLDADLLLDVVIAAGALLVVCFVAYLPFYLTFSAPSQGIGIVTGTANHLAVKYTDPTAVASANIFTRTWIGDEIGVNGLMLAILGTFLLVLAARRLAAQIRLASASRLVPAIPMPRPTDLPMLSMQSAGSSLGRTAPRMLLTTSSSGTMPRPKIPADPATDPGITTPHPRVPLRMSQGAAWGRAWIALSLAVAGLGVVTWLTNGWEWWTFLWAMLIMGAALWLAIAPIATPTATVAPETPAEGDALRFPLLMIALGAGLIALCEIVFLRDVFIGVDPRMNTVFKAYFQIWILFAIAGAPALAWLATHARDAVPGGAERAWRPVVLLWRGVWVAGILVVVGMGLIYPLGASHRLYPLGQNVSPSLNGLTDNASLDPGDIAAIQWLNAHVTGSPIIVEGEDPSNPLLGDYSLTAARVSVFTGLPTIFGWSGHEYQWRVTWLKDPVNAADYNARLRDLNLIYTSVNPAVVLGLLHHYHASYLYAGPVEWQIYGAKSDLSRFRTFLPVAYAAGDVTIYRVP